MHHRPRLAYSIGPPPRPANNYETLGLHSLKYFQVHVRRPMVSPVHVRLTEMHEG